MGNICHVGPVELLEASQVETPPPKKPLTFGKDSTLKREDYIFSNIRVPSLLTKLPGSINGQQFIIEDCSDCDVFLLDNCTSVQIDECVNCRIVVGPCQASLFLRNCKRCTLVCAVQQFRTRDCVDVDVYLYSATGTTVFVNASWQSNILRWSFHAAMNPNRADYRNVNASPVCLLPNHVFLSSAAIRASQILSLG